MTERECKKGGVTRRKVLTGMGLGGLVATMLASMGATARYLFPQVFYEPSLRSKVGAPTDFTEDSVRYLEDERVFLHRERDGFYAISAICTHLGCVVAQDDQGFHCPCHGSVFDPDGNVTAGPAPRTLPWYEVTLSAEGQLVVDRGRTVPVGTRVEA